MRAISMFTKVNPLPSAEGQTSLTDRDVQRRAQQRAFRVCRHVVFAFVQMLVGIVFRNEFIEDRFHIDANVGRGVFVDRQRGAGVLNEDVHQTDLDLFDFRNLLKDFVRHQMKASPFRRQRDEFLVPTHLEIDVEAKLEERQQFFHSMIR